MCLFVSVAFGTPLIGSAGEKKLAAEADTRSTANPLPNAKPGECYVRVRVPAVYKTVKETVVLTPETIRYEIVPAKFRTVEKKVLIRPEVKRYEVVPAKFEKKLVDVETDPAHKELQASSPKLVDRKQTVVIQPERNVWKQGQGILGEVGSVVGDIWCLVREEAVVEKFSTKQLEKPAKVTAKPIRAKKTQVETLVMTTPARVKEIVEPAQYKTIKVRELVAPATQKKVVVPAKTKTVDRQVLEEAESIAWERVLCSTNITESVVKRIEAKLEKAGFDAGGVNGSLGPQTLDAVRKYQLKHKLATGGLTYEFLEHLGIRF